MRELSPLGRAIVDGGRDGDRSTPADRVRVRAKLGRVLAAGTVLGAGAATGGTALAAVSKAGAASWGLSWIVAPVAIAAVAVGVGTAVDRAPSESAPPRAAMVAPVVTERVRVSVAPPGDAPAAFEKEAEVETEPPPSSGAPAARAPASAPAVAPQDPLLAEARRLGEAQKALNAGDPARALALLKERGAADGQLGEERAAMQAIALCRDGRVAEGRAAVSRFLRERPASPYAGRVRAACSE